MHTLLGEALGVLEQTDTESTESSETTETTVDIICGNGGHLCDAIYEWTGSEAAAETTSFLLGVPLKIVIVVVGALVVNRLAKKWIKKITKRLGTVTADHGDVIVEERSVKRAEERARTIGSLLRSLTTATVFALSVILVLSIFGINVLPMIASLGVIGLAIGFGAQSVVEDLFRGVFMLAEDQFGLGDRVDVGVVNGYVERVTLRTTVIRASDGTLWHVPNSQIDHVANEYQRRARAEVELELHWETDFARVTEVLTNAATAASQESEWAEFVHGDPQVQGAMALGDGFTMRVTLWVDPEERRHFERHLRRRLKEALDGAGIAPPNPELDLYVKEQAVAA
ncbi:MAG: mechanosensitive ion channel family protein [Ilumatobacteraceae bacterium]